MSKGPWTSRPWDREAILGRLQKYLEEEEIPILAEFCYRERIPRTTLLTWDESAELVEMCRLKKEAALEAGALDGSLNTTMAIFSLKQLGWTDRHDLTHANPDGSALTVKILRLGDAEKAGS